VSLVHASSLYARTRAVIGESLGQELPLRLPTTEHPLVAAAIAHTDASLATVRFADVCAEVATSPRTLRREFHAELGIPWSRYVAEARMLRAIALLSEPGPSLLAVARAVGF